MTTEIEFAVHGAICKQCNADIKIYVHCKATRLLLHSFIGKHGLHKGFHYVCKITGPPEFVNDQWIEVTFANRIGASG